MDIPFSDELSTKLVDLLAELPPGERLPSERALAEKLGVSRTALRDRLMRLESVGTIERRTGSGTYLRELSSKSTGDTIAMGMRTNNLRPDSMRPVRAALEREAARLAAKRTDHMNLAHMAEALDEMEIGTENKELRDADYRFHTALLAASGSDGLIFFSDVMRDILRATVLEVPLAQRQAEMIPIHRPIFEAVQRKDPEGAMRAVDTHFEWLESMVESGTLIP